VNEGLVPRLTPSPEVARGPRALNGGTWVPHLTDREIEVLHLVAQGLGNREIGTRLFVSEETVKTHVKMLLEKLGARSRAHAVARALRGGLIV
jgi:DNA-binding NarL/FixJ family response regulator